MMDPKTEDSAYLKYTTPPRRYTLGDTISDKQLKQFEDTVVGFLLSLNRHERRAWCAKLCRKAGTARDDALRATMSNNKILYRASREAKLAKKKTTAR